METVTPTVLDTTHSMSTQNIPNSQKQIIQGNDGDYGGNLWATFGVDLETNPGTIKTAKKFTRVLGADEISDDIVQALTIYDGNYVVVTNNQVLDCSVNDDPTDPDNWSDISTLGLEDLGLETDAVTFNNLLLLSLGTDVMTWNGSSKDEDWWTTVSKGGETGTALTANFPHTMSVLRSGQDTLFVTDKNTVRYANLTAGHTTITLDTLLVANTLTPSLDRMWAGTYTEVEENALVYELRVGDDTALQSYQVDGRACLTMFTYKNIPFVITEKGYVQAFDGAGFQTVAQFPWANMSTTMVGARAGLVQDSPTGMAIHPKGAKVQGKYCYIYVNAEDEFTGDLIDPSRGYSGVWVLNLETYSLTHKYALCTDDYGWSKVSRSGPLMLTNSPYTRLMVGGEIDTNEEGVWMESTGTPQSFIVTTRHEAQSLLDAFEKASIKADTLDDDSSIVVKYKDTVQPNFPLVIDGITWLNGTQFTTSNALSRIDTDRDGVYNWEVFIHGGHKAGYMAQITNIEGSTTKTVTIDTDLGTLNEVSDIAIENWTLINDTMTDESGEILSFGDSQPSISRQYKVIMTGDVTIREVLSDSNNKNTK